MSVLKNMDWYQDLEDIPERVIEIPESIESDQYIIDNDFFDGDFFSIEMYQGIIGELLEKY